MRLTATRTLAATMLLAAVSLTGCFGGSDDEDNPPVLERVGERAEVRDEIEAILRGSPEPALEEARSVLLDPVALAQDGATVLGGRLALLVRDMEALPPGAYARKYGNRPGPTAAALGRLLGELTAEVEAALSDASDAQRVAAIEWGLRLAAGFARTFRPGRASGEAVVGLALPREARSAEGYPGIAPSLMALLDHRPGAEGAGGKDTQGAAELMSQELPETDAADVIAAVAGELSERIPAPHLASFLSAYDATVNR